MTDDAETMTVRPWHRQFYLRRGASEWKSDQVSDAGYKAGVEAIEGFVYVGTTMFGSPTRLSIRTHSSDPGPPQSADRSAEVTITGAGNLAVLNWDPGEPCVGEVELPDGPVCARVSWHGTKQAAAHEDCEVGGERSSPEYLVLDVWPSAEHE
ncbi:MAG: hypothetical protein R2733_14545 [Acidimicrobiales bacterium]